METSLNFFFINNKSSYSSFHHRKGESRILKSFMIHITLERWFCCWLNARWQIIKCDHQKIVFWHKFPDRAYWMGFKALSSDYLCCLQLLNCKWERKLSRYYYYSKRQNPFSIRNVSTSRGSSSRKRMEENRSLVNIFV